VLTVTKQADGVSFGVHAKPKSSRSKLLGIKDGRLVVALRAPPVDGAANAELLKLLAKQLGVRRAAVSLKAGQSGRRKVVQVSGLTAVALHARLDAILGGSDLGDGGAAS
jgi:uncharacterized protein (TIGR00251 family)